VFNSPFTFYTEFVLVFLTHIQKLLEDQEQYVAHAGHWVKSDAAKASNMKQSETLRFVCL